MSLCHSWKDQKKQIRGEKKTPNRGKATLELLTQDGYSDALVMMTLVIWANRFNWKMIRSVYVSKYTPKKWASSRNETKCSVSYNSVSFTSQTKKNAVKQYAAPHCTRRLLIQLMKQFTFAFQFAFFLSFPKYVEQCNAGVVELTSTIFSTTVGCYCYAVKCLFSYIYSDKPFNGKTTLFQSWDTIIVPL